MNTEVLRAELALPAYAALVAAGSVRADAVTGAVGSVTGAVGSVTGNVGGNVNGNVSGSVGSVTGAVGSVTGAVGSVTGNVGGSTASVAGAVGSVSGGVGGDVAGKVLGGGSGTISGDGVRASSVTGAVGSVTGAVGSVTGSVTLTPDERAAIAAALLDLTDGVETGLTPRESLRAMAAALVGILSGAATTTITVKAANNSGTTRIVSTVDADGNRSAITLTL